MALLSTDRLLGEPHARFCGYGYTQHLILRDTYDRVAAQNITPYAQRHMLYDNLRGNIAFIQEHICTVLLEYALKAIGAMVIIDPNGFDIACAERRTVATGVQCRAVELG